MRSSAEISCVSARRANSTWDCWKRLRLRATSRGSCPRRIPHRGPHRSAGANGDGDGLVRDGRAGHRHARGSSAPRGRLPDPTGRECGSEREPFPAHPHRIRGWPRCSGCWPRSTPSILKLLLRNGEQLLPPCSSLIRTAHRTHPAPLGDFRHTASPPSVLAIMALAVISTAFTGQAIAVAFDPPLRRPRPPATALLVWGDHRGQALAVVTVVVFCRRSCYWAASVSELATASDGPATGCGGDRIWAPRRSSPWALLLGAP